MLHEGKNAGLGGVENLGEALLNSLIATGYKIPSKDKGIMLSSGGAKEKASLLDGAQALVRTILTSQY